ncbi:MAG: hypothetical protein ACOYN6_01845 [Ignavibacteria bacterium]
MKKPLLTKENILLMFTLGIAVLKSMKEIYESKERTTTDEDTSKNINRDNQKDTNSSNTANNH